MKISNFYYHSGKEVQQDLQIGVVGDSSKNGASTASAVIASKTLVSARTIFGQDAVA